MISEFHNEPFTDFGIPGNAQAYRDALEQVREQLGRTYPLVIDGEQVSTEATSTSINPAQPDQIVGRFARATVEHANQAVEAAARAFESWRFVVA